MNVVILADDPGAAARLAATIERETEHAVARVARSVGSITALPARSAVIVSHRSPIGARLWVARLRQGFGSQVPILLVVRADDPSELPHVLTAGVDDFIVWPAPSALLATRLDLAARRHLATPPADPPPPEAPPTPPPAPSGPVSQTLQALLRALPDTAIYWLDDDGVFTDFHCDDPRALPTSPAQLVGRRVEDVLPPELAGRYREAIDAVIAGAPLHEVRYGATDPEGAAHEAVARFVRLGDAEVLATVRFTPSPPDADAAPGEGAGGDVAPDVLLSALPVTVYVYDHLTKRLLYANRPFQTALGQSLDEQLAQPIDRLVEVVHPEDRPGIAGHAGAWEAAPDGEVREARFRVRGPGGVWRWVLSRETVLRRDAGGMPVEIVGVAMDASAHGASVERLRASEERLRLALSGRDDLVYEWDLATGEMRYFGDAASARGLPTTRARWEGRIHEDDLPVVQLGVRRHLEEGVPFSETYRIRWVDNTWRHCVDRGAASRDDAGRPTRWIGVCTDITDRVERQDRLSQDEKLEAVAHLAGGIAQDFNRLLLSIFSHLDVAAAELPAGPARDDLLAARRAADKAVGLTRQLLAFGRRQQLQPEYVSINDVVGDAVESLARRLGPGVELSFESSEQLGMVLADPLQLEQILLTLGLRARETMPSGGRLAIITSSVRGRDALAALRPEARGARYVRLRVEDSGTGIPPELLEHVFDPFYAAEDGGPRTGLDLAMVYGIVDQHEGLMTAENLPGGGAAFNIYLPVVERPPARMRRREEPTRGGHETLLLVDDDELVRKMAQRMLRGAGYEVLTARDGVEALKIYQVRHGEIALVVLDMVMPRMGGRATYEAMARIDPTTPFIFVSGYTMSAQDTEFVQHRGRRFLPKPFNAGQLLREIRTCLDEG